MANGYSTLAAVVSNPDNLPQLQIDFDRAFWRQHAFIDPFLGAVWDYFQANRSSSYIEKWREWIDADWVGSYIESLAPFGLKVPRDYCSRERARSMARAYGCDGRIRSMAAASSGDSIRSRPPTWNGSSGNIPAGMAITANSGRSIGRRCDPRNGELSLSLFASLPPLCRVCQMPCVFPAPRYLDLPHQGVWRQATCVLLFCMRKILRSGAAQVSRLYQLLRTIRWLRSGGLHSRKWTCCAPMVRLSSHSHGSISSGCGRSMTSARMRYEIRNPLRNE